MEAQQDMAQNAQAQTADLSNVFQTSSMQAADQTAQSISQYISQTPIHFASPQTQQDASQILGLTNLSIPTMQDIAKYEASMITNQGSGDVQKLTEMLQRISGASPLTSPAEKEKFGQIRERIVQQAHQGNAIAKSVNQAATPGGGAGLPQSNEVQQVNLDDYEEIKKTWIENYRSLEPPDDPSGTPMDRKAWLKSEVAQIPTVIDLLLSGDPAKVEQGKRMVSKILPFLLLGGFSKAEIVGYLKAKLEAAKVVMNEVLQVQQQKNDEENMVSVEGSKKEEASMHMHATLPEQTSEEAKVGLPQDIKISSDPTANKESDSSHDKE